MQTYAIIGFGTAGYHAVKAIRQLDAAGRIDVYTDTGLAPYNPMLTTYYVGGKLLSEGMFPFGTLETMSRDLSFQPIHATVRAVRCARREVETQDGAVRRYDRILLSTGASAFAPSIPGLEGDNRFFMRTYDDAEKLRHFLDTTRVTRAVVVGASMVGIKVVELLAARGIETYLADLAPGMFPLAAYPEVGAEIGRRVERRGVRLRFGRSVSGVEDGVAVMTDGERIPVELVVLCIGTRANVALADPEEVRVERAFVVNERMETSAPGVYAAGDCCAGRNIQSESCQVIGLWANANHQGTVAGENMAGGDAAFAGNILHNITHFMDMDFIGFGDNRIQGEVLTSGKLESGLYLRAVCRDGRLAGANILDSYPISGIVKNYMLRLFKEPGCALPDFQRGMLVRAGLSERFIERLEAVLNGNDGSPASGENSLSRDRH